MPLLSIIVAMDESGVIGKNNGLPWHLPADLRHFKQITMGKPVLMGRKTFESIGKPLPGREFIVLTRDKSFAVAGCRVVQTLDEGIEAAADKPELVVIGGAEIFALALPLVSRIYLTRVHARVDGDTYFPAFDRREWLAVSEQEYPADERNAHALTFMTLERRGCA